MANTDDEEDVGAGLTGRKIAPPTQDIMAPAPQPVGGGFLSDPRDRAALLQMGLQLMQPVAFGQTVGGHIGQAIGAGGEAVDRGDLADLKERQADAKLAIADERLRIAQQNADTRERRGLGGAIKGLTANQELVRQRNERKDAEAAQSKKEEAALADATYKATVAQKNRYDSEHPYVKKGYHNMTPQEIMRAEAGTAGAPAGGGGGVPTATDPKTGKKKQYVNGNWVDVP
jgi:hypothetical protein